MDRENRANGYFLLYAIVTREIFIDYNLLRILNPYILLLSMYFNRLLNAFRNCRVVLSILHILSK